MCPSSISSFDSPDQDTASADHDAFRAGQAHAGQHVRGCCRAADIAPPHTACMHAGARVSQSQHRPVHQRGGAYCFGGRSHAHVHRLRRGACSVCVMKFVRLAVAGLRRRQLRGRVCAGDIMPPKGVKAAMDMCARRLHYAMLACAVVGVLLSVLVVDSCCRGHLRLWRVAGKLKPSAGSAPRSSTLKVLACSAPRQPQPGRKNSEINIADGQRQAQILAADGPAAAATACLVWGR